MPKLTSIAAVSAGAVLVLMSQDFGTIKIPRTGSLPAIAIPEFRGDARSQPFLGAFNQTLWADVESAGILRMVPSTLYPKTVPQQPSDFRDGAPNGQAPPATRPENGLRMSDWSSPPAQANYLAFGYTATQGNVLVLQGWLFDLSRGSAANAQVIGKRYTGALGEEGARRLAHEFAADIIAQFGGKSLFGTHIYFVRQQAPGGPKEIWVMDPDGHNERQLTRLNTLTIEPAVSPDGNRLAVTSWRGGPGIFLFSLDPFRELHFYNPPASLNSSPSFTPDGRQIVYSSSAGSARGCCRIYIAEINGAGFRPLSGENEIDTEPKVNPKTGRDLIFSSGRTGRLQIYQMNLDGADLQRLSDGTGEAANPAWHPSGQMIAYAWTRGYATGGFNIFTMDIASHQYTQLTHGEGKNEYPCWAPDGVHIVFASTRGGSSQIYTMLADGTQVRRLTSQGKNDRPVWGK